MEIVIAGITGLIGLYYLRKWCEGGHCYSRARLDGKTVVITGCNTGIGRTTALDLSKRGAKIAMACRNLEQTKIVAEEIRKEGGGKVAIYKLDLANLASVKACAEEIIAKEDKINILINNAGIMLCPELKTEDGFEMQMGTNHLGHFLFTNLLLDKMKATNEPGRIVNVSSIGHKGGAIDLDDLHFRKKPYNRLTAYFNSKLANILFTRELAKKLRGSKLSCYVLHPGAVKTDLTRHMDTWLGFFHHIFWILAGFFYKDAVQGAQTTIFCAVDESLGSKSGLYYADCAEKTPTEAAQDDEMAKKLWEFSVKEVGL